jgi:hypothetical protein
VYQRFIFHLSRCLRAAARAFALTFFAMGSTLGGMYCGGYPTCIPATNLPYFKNPLQQEFPSCHRAN